MRYLISQVFLLICFSVLSAAESCPEATQLGQRTVCTFVGDRPIVMDLWFPTCEGSPQQLVGVWSYPPIVYESPVPTDQRRALVLLSHGYGGERKELLWLAAHLARAGYIVASLDHYGNTWKDPTPQGMIALWRRPQDVSHAIDYLTQESSLRQAIDSEQIAFVGFSVGGMTALWLAGAQVEAPDRLTSLADSMAFRRFFPQGVDSIFLQGINFSEGSRSYQDRRISLFVLLAPRVSEFSRASRDGIQAPLLVIYGEKDSVLSPEEHALAIESSQLELLALPEAGHFVFLNEVSEQGKQALPPDLWKESVDRAVLHERIGERVLKFLKNNS